MQTKIKHLLPLMLVAAFLSGGCATKMVITSEPAGAMVRLRGEGRAAFRWQTGPTVTPCEMDVYYGRVSVYVIWPEKVVDGGKTGMTFQNGTKSEKKEIELSAWRDVEKVHFVKPQ